MLALNTLAIGVASLFVVVSADHGHLLPRSHHHNVAERSEHHLRKRFGGRATYYQTGLGACGKYNNPSDKIVALNAPQFGDGYPGPNCFKEVEICKGNVCHNAQITDRCPGCPYGALDMSESLFTQFASTDDGVFEMTWSFAGEKPETTAKPDPPKTTFKPDPPKTTEKPEPEPKPEPTTTRETTTKKRTTSKPETTSTPEPTTSTSTSTSAEPTTTSTLEAKSSATSTSEIPTSTSNESATPSATATSSATGSGSGSGSSSGSNWVDMNQIMLAMGRLATVANGA